MTLANSRSCELTGYGPDEIVGLVLLETYMPEEREVGRRRLAEVPAGATVRFERLLRRKDGSSIPIDVSVASLPDGERQSIMRDISARKRAEETRRAEEARLRALVRLSEVESKSLPELLDATLEEIVALSDSLYGHIYYYSAETQQFVRHAWSRAVMDACRIGDRPQTRRLSDVGIWGEAVRQRRPIVVNNFAAPNPLRRGYPEGHAPLTRFMTIPVISRGKIVAVVGVANKQTAYTDADVSQLTQMMDVVWKIAERQRAEDELRRLAGELECRVEERTREFEHANAELEAANTELGGANRELQSLLREQERLQAELAYRAMHDPLTGLANRIMFGERLDHAIRVGERGVAVVWIDLDHFKEVNDIFGHDVGDEMLVAVRGSAQRCGSRNRRHSPNGRRRIAVILPNVIETEAQMVAERIISALSDRSRSGFRWVPASASPGSARQAVMEWLWSGTQTRRCTAPRRPAAAWRSRTETVDKAPAIRVRSGQRADRPRIQRLPRSLLSTVLGETDVSLRPHEQGAFFVRVGQDPGLPGMQPGVRLQCERAGLLR